MVVEVTKKPKSKPKAVLINEVSKDTIKETKKTKSKSKGVVIKENIGDDQQQKKKRKVTGVLKSFLKIRAQTVEDQSSITPPEKEILDKDEAGVETDDDAIDTKDQIIKETQHVSP